MSVFIKYFSDNKYQPDRNVTEIPDKFNIGVSSSNSYFDHPYLEIVDLSKSKIKRIGKSSFESNSHLQTIEFCDSLETIDDKAFYNCELIEDLDLSKLNNLKSIGIKAFAKPFSFFIKSLNVYLPKNIESFSPISFSGHTYIHLYPDSKNFVQDADTNAIFSKDKKTLVWVPFDAKDFIIPDYVKNIDKHCFSNCDQLKSLYFPKGFSASPDFFENGFNSLSFDDFFTTNKNKVYNNEVFIDASNLAKTIKQHGGFFMSHKDWNSELENAEVLITDSYGKTSSKKYKDIAEINKYTNFGRIFDINTLFVKNIIKIENIPEGITNIACGLLFDYDSSYHNFKYLKEIPKFPTSLKIIDSSIYFGSDNIKEYIIPYHITKFTAGNFNPNTILKIDPKNTSFFQDEKTGAIYSKDKKTLVWIPKETEKFIIPDSVEVLGTNCLKNREHLTQVYFSKGIKNINNIDEKELFKNSPLSYLDFVDFKSYYLISNTIKNFGDFTLFKEPRQKEPLFVFGKASAPKIEQKFRISNLCAFNKIMAENPRLSQSVFFDQLKIKLSKIKETNNKKIENVDKSAASNCIVFTNNSTVPYNDFAIIDETTNYGKILIPKSKNIDAIASFPRGIEEIGKDAFCFKIDGPNNINFDSLIDLKRIGSKAFSFCNFKTLDLSKCTSLETIDDRAFENSIIETLKLPDNLKTIGHNAFFADNRIGNDLRVFEDNISPEKDNYFPKDVYLPENLSQLYRNSFSPKTKLHVHPNSEYLYQDEKFGNIYSKNDKTVLWIQDSFVPPCNDIEIPKRQYQLKEDTKSFKAVDLSNSKIKFIEEASFYNNNELEEIKFCEVLEKIDTAAFKGCPIKELDFSMCKNLKAIRAEAFSDFKGTDVYLPENVTMFYSNSFGYNAHIHIAENSKYLTQDKDTGAILSKSGKTLLWVPKDITNYIIPETVNGLDADVFYFRNKLESLTITSDIEYINEHFLYNPNFGKNDEKSSSNILKNTPLDYTLQISDTDKTSPFPLSLAAIYLGSFTIYKPSDGEKRQTFQLGDYLTPLTNKTDFLNITTLANLKRNNPDKSLKELLNNVEGLHFLDNDEKRTCKEIDNHKKKTYIEIEL